MSGFVDYVHGWSIGSMIIRLVIAMLIGVIIGLDREIKNRGAGMKTHALVCIGAALAMMISEYVFFTFPDAKADMNRIGAQVISGVGFLGVGTIIVTGRNQIQGLTTAAGLWVCACAGLAIGIGYIEGTIIAVILVVFTLKVLDKFDVKVHKYSKRIDLYVEFADGEGEASFLNWMHQNHYEMRHLELGEGRRGNALAATFDVYFNSVAERRQFENHMNNIPGQSLMEEIN